MDPTPSHRNHLSHRFHGSTPILLAILCISASLCSGVHAEAVIEISSASEFLAIQFAPSGTYSLTSDIDLSGTAVPSVKKFSGTLNGNGHVIKNAVIKSGSPVYDSNREQHMCFGLFSSCQGVTVKNLRLENVIVEANDAFFADSVRAGALCGTGSGTFDGVSVEASSVKSADGSQVHAIGGLLGVVASPSTISHCSINAQVEFEGKELGTIGGTFGGIVAIVSDSGTLIEKCSADVDIVFSGDAGYVATAGGIVGESCALTMQMCSYSGVVFLNGAATAGLLLGMLHCSAGGGWDSGDCLPSLIEDCAIYGSFEGSGQLASVLGGFAIGFLDCSCEDSVTVRNVLIAPEIQGENFVSGFSSKNFVLGDALTSASLQGIFCLEDAAETVASAVSPNELDYSPCTLVSESDLRSPETFGSTSSGEGGLDFSDTWCISRKNYGGIPCLQQVRHDSGGRMVCANGFSAASLDSDCEGTECFDPSDGLVCLVRGDCEVSTLAARGSADGTLAVCVCDGLYGGAHCSHCKVGANMTADGRCVNSACFSDDVYGCPQNEHCEYVPGSDAFMCICDEGYVDHIGVCYKACPGCKANAECVADVSALAFVCHCVEGYTEHQGDCYKWCGDCPSHAECVFASGGFTCQCTAGFIPYGEDCLVSCPGCQSGASCVPSVALGRFVCECDAGNRQHEDGNCYPWCEACQAGASCEPVSGGFACQCSPDLVLLDGDCYTPCPACGENEECVPDRESLAYVCRCTDGYIEYQGNCLRKCPPCGEGQHCEARLEERAFECVCDQGKVEYEGACYEPCPECMQNGECVFTSGGFVCTCMQGFSPYMGECLVPCSECPQHSACVPSLDALAYVCECEEGFVDVDGVCYRECPPCGENEHCEASPEELAFLCVCDNRFLNVEGKCYADCTECGPHMSCEFAGSGFECICDPGYVEVAGECFLTCQGCQKGEECVFDNGFSCQCQAGLVRHESGVCVSNGCGPGMVCEEGDCTYVEGEGYKCVVVEPDPPKEPEEPTEPDDPDPPEEPDKPDPPKDPEPPEEPAEPDPPKEPEEPDEPKEPEEPEEPEEPSPPQEPEEPEDPEDPEEPEEPKDPDGADVPPAPPGPDGPDSPDSPDQPDDPALKASNSTIMMGLTIAMGAALIGLPIALGALACIQKAHRARATLQNTVEETVLVY